MINPRPNIKTASREDKKQKLVLVRSGALYGLVFEQAKSEKVSINRGIVSTPSFVFFSNNTKCFIDYTNQTNQTVEKTVDNTFSQVAAGTTFELYNGTYTDPNSIITANLSGIYTFNSYNNGIINATVNSGQAFDANLNRYDRLNFDDIPYFKLNTIGSGTTLYTIVKNRLGRNTKNSFNYLGVKANDYVKFTGYDFPTKVLEINIDSDGNEYLLLDGILTYEDVTSKLTNVEVYFDIIDSYETEPNITETEVGACIQYQNGIFVSCTNNHTPSQCRFRSSAINGITTELTIGTFCNTLETDTAVQTTITENLVQVTSALVSAVANSTSVAGPILKNTNSKNAFYGKPF